MVIVAKRQTHKEQGIALVLVLWLIVLLSVIGGSHARNGRMELTIAGNQFKSLKARSHAEAGVYLAIEDLISRQGNSRYLLRGMENREDFLGTSLSISIVSAVGLVDINNADTAVLSALFNSAGMKAEEQDALVDSILDWRDADDLVRLNGAEKKQYDFARLPYAPANGAFRSVNELKLVLGMNMMVYREIVPFITVDARTGEIDTTQAPLELLQRLGQVSGDQVLLETGGGESDGETFNAKPSHPVFHLEVYALTKEGGSAHIRVTVDISRREKERYRILSWRELPGKVGYNNG
ncbi:MAG: general secretion pathway protein GspK [gamma proteobacterium endosymbiont of Lamellibrachia anaximandri]|nr:general secretion pathway protein GspK [gamma proteobacterium endosymbiont of Lamellibrachia anaximandri]MBL3534102.1 general secretion pathway protein GspK [gamma proteobacterium endosymbiont of Lamellibrachia anaximandri]